MTIEESVISNDRLPFARFGGKWYCIETKPTLLDAGITTLSQYAGDLVTDIFGPTGFTAVFQEGEMSSTLRDATTDPDVLALARKFQARCQAGTVQPGPL